MRIQEVPRSPDETFYFDDSQASRELVVDQAALGDGPWPNVEVYSDRSVIMTIEKQDGEVAARGLAACGQHTLFSGERLKGIRTGSEVACRVEAQPDDWKIEIGGEQTGEYTPADEDELIVHRQAYDYGEGDKVMIFPIRTFLPVAFDATYQALGIMRPNGALVAWGAEAYATSWFTDLANANALARDQGDLQRLRDELGRDRHLVSLIRTSVHVTAYLKHFLDKFGVDFMPTHDPRER